MDNTLYTVGHSNSTLEKLLSLLQLAGVDCIIDVRSTPASAYSPHFNKESLQRFLKANGILYGHFGEEFGARRTDSIIDGQVNFAKAVTTEAFQRGVERIRNGLSKGYNIAFMCSEAKPLEYHRFSMISRYFVDNGYNVKHILHNETIVPHHVLEKEMIDEYIKKKKIKEVDLMFGEYDAETQRDDAYKIKNKEIGYKPGDAYENQE
jgi:uncharacterized protein (DUF488 family)